MAIPKKFTDLAPRYMQKLKDDFGFTTEDAAAIIGNAGHESLGFTVLQEIAPRGGRGGLGWFQWTGPRRRDFEAFLKGRSPADPELNYAMLFRELKGSEKSAVLKTKIAVGLYNKVVAFEAAYERAGVKAYPSRFAYAQAALAAFQAAYPDRGPLPPPPDIPTPPSPLPEESSTQVRGFWACFINLLLHGSFQ